MSITYEEALGTLQAMFQEPWTRDTLDAVLRHQKGHMENTVDIILRHGTKDPQVLIEQLDAGVDPDQSLMALDEQLARQLQAAATTSQRPGGVRGGVSTSTGIGTPTTLPDDFLRIPNYRPPASSSASYSVSDDEALARMLQDELFTEELRRNPDFAHLAGSRRAVSANNHAQIRQSATASNNAFGSMPQIPNPFAGFASRFTSSGQQQQQQQHNNNQNIMDKLSEMGEGAKRRLQLMAAQFQAANANRAGGNSSLALGEGVAPGERRSLLLDDADDMELAARKDL